MFSVGVECYTSATGFMIRKVKQVKLTIKNRTSDSVNLEAVSASLQSQIDEDIEATRVLMGLPSDYPKEYLLSLTYDEKAVDFATNVNTWVNLARTLNIPLTVPAQNEGRG